MDILQPELVWIDGSCYRFFDKDAWSQGNDLAAYVEESYEPHYESNDEEEYGDLEIVPETRCRYKHSFYVNNIFHRFIIGIKGMTKKKIEVETKTTIQVPKFGQNGDIVIIGANRRSITAARRGIDMLIEVSRKKLDFTHFISIPGNQDIVLENFNKFKKDVLENCAKGSRGIREELFVMPEKLHLTITMLVLLDEEDERKAKEALETCKQNIINPIIRESGPLTIEFRGVECMNDDPSEVKVLFIKAIDDGGCLQEISDKIADYFVQEGLARNDYDRVKLHMTAMNAKFADVQKGNTQTSETFDARKILKKHANTLFGKVVLSTIHISQLQRKSSDKYYYSTAAIDLTKIE